MKKKEEMAKQIFDNWVKDNGQLIEDYYKLCYDALMFKVKWGINITINLEDYSQEKGGRVRRNLGKIIS